LSKSGILIVANNTTNYSLNQSRECRVILNVMNTPTHERRQTIIFRLALTSAVLGLIITLALVGLEVYVRWFKDKGFTFLGGFELGALTISVFVLIIGMIYTYRST